MKKCITCGIEKPLDDFYKHAEMRDGHLNKRKECVKSYILEHRAKNIDFVRAYDRRRAKSPENVRRRVEVTRRRRKEVKNYGSAHSAVSRALRNGTIKKPTACEQCGEEKLLHAHHENYDNPLDVKWLCVACHAALHKRSAAEGF